MSKKRPPVQAEPIYLEPPTPRYNISRILQTKRKIQRACDFLVGHSLGRRNFLEFTLQVGLSLPYKGKGVDEDVIRKSVQGLAATRLTKESLSATAWRLAGNVAHLRSCTTVLPWGRQLRPEWAPVQVLSAPLNWTRKRRMGADFQLRFLAGSACPLVVEKFWTSGFCGMFSQNLGFTAPWNDTPYCDPRQLVGMRFYVKIEPELCTDKPDFHEVKVPSGCKTWNKQLLVLRYRTNPELFQCPAGYPLEHPCHLCPVGADRCEAAVHAKTFIQKCCNRCRSDDAWFDPCSRRKICMDCFHKLKRSGQM